MRYLIQTVETYRADTEAEAQGVIAEAKAAGEYVLAKYSSEKKEVKAKGEVIDEFYKVTLTKVFTSLKEPEIVASIIYEVE
jgi:hypothetical protein